MVSRKLTLLLLLILVLAGVGSASAQTAITSDLVACWELKESGGARDDTWDGFVLTDNNTVGSETGNINNLASSYVSANSESLSYIDDDLLDAVDGFTIAIWLKAPASGTTAGIVSKWDVATAGWYVQRLPSNQIQFRVYDGSGGLNSVNAGAVTDAWQLLVAWYNDGDDEYGVELNGGGATTYTTGNTGGSNSTANIIFGCKNMTPTTCNLHIDAGFGPTAIWDRAISSGERSQVWNGGSGISCDELTGGGDSGTYNVTLPSGRQGAITMDLTVGDILQFTAIGVIVVLLIFGLLRQTVFQSKAAR